MFRGPNQTHKACLASKYSKVIQFVENFFEGNPPEDPPTMILGFPGVGMVGVITISEIIDQIEDIKQIGYVVSEDLPPIAIFYDGVLKHPLRLYYSRKYNLFLSLCEVPFKNESYSDITRALLDWAMRLKVKEVMCISGIAEQGKEFMELDYPVFGAAEEQVLERLNRAGIEKLQKGLIMGVEASVLNECMNNQLDGMLLMVNAHPQVPAPEAAAAIIEKINDLYKLELTTDNLLEEANKIKQRLMEISQKAQNTRSMGQNPENRSGSGFIYS